jgi:hypothetical protein
MGRRITIQCWPQAKHETLPEKNKVKKIWVHGSNGRVLASKHEAKFKPQYHPKIIK